MQVSTLPLSLFTRPLPVTLPKDALKVRAVAARLFPFKSILQLKYMQECVATETQALLASMPNARAAKAHEAFYGHVIVSGRHVELCCTHHHSIAALSDDHDITLTILQRRRVLLDAGP